MPEITAEQKEAVEQGLAAIIALDQHGNPYPGAIPILARTCRGILGGVLPASIMANVIGDDIRKLSAEEDPN